MFVNTEGVTYVHLRVVNTEGVTFRSVHKPNWDNHWTNQRVVTTADHPSVGGLRCSQPSEIGTSTGAAAANQRFFERLAIDLGLSVSMSVSLCRSLCISVCLQRSWSVGVHVGLFSVDLCRSRSLCRSVSILVSMSVDLSLSLSLSLSVRCSILKTVLFYIDILGWIWGRSRYSKPSQTRLLWNGGLLGQRPSPPKRPCLSHCHYLNKTNTVWLDFRNLQKKRNLDVLRSYLHLFVA